jgi:hypothetical protein
MDWGNLNSAVAISGSPYHTSLVDLDDAGGSQDRSLSADSVIFPGSITIIKDVKLFEQGGEFSSQDFSFTATPSPLSGFTLDDDQDPTLSNTKVFAGITSFTNYDVAETLVNGWNLDSTIACVVTSPNGGSQTPITNGIRVNLKEGENVSCTFVNNENIELTRGKIKVVKTTVGGLDTFTFTANFGSAPFTVTTDASHNPSSKTVSALIPGSNYQISENDLAGWTKGTFSCDNGTPDAITVVAGQTTTCEITNTKKAHLVVQKTTLPGGDLSSFTISASGTGTITGGGAGSVTDATDKDYEVTPGTYSVAETVPSGWDKTGDTCQNVVVAAGETQTCLLTNTKKGHLIVQKTTVPAADATSFTISASGSGTITGGGAGSVTDATDKDYEVTPGTYSVSETVPNGWTKTGDTCQNVAVAAGETKTCLLTNTKQGHIIVKKVTVPASNTTTLFSFTTTGTGYTTGFNLTNGQSNDSGVLSPGGYSVAETALTGWDNTSAVCDGTGNTPASITLAAGQTVTCTFTNTQRGRLIVEKLTNPAGAAGSFTFTFTGTGTPGPTSIGAGGNIPVGNLVPGTYTAAESDPTPGFDLSTIVCNDTSSATPSSGSVGTRTATFKVDPGETVKCTFTNTKRVTVIVKKAMVGGTDTFNFTGTPSGSINANNGTIQSINVAPGQYVSTEGTTAGWDLTSVTCDDGNSVGSVADKKATFNAEAGETVTCTFTNTKRGKAQVVKTFNGGPLGSNSFTFQLRSGASASAAGTTLESGTATGLSNTISFTTTLTPGTTYQLCEQMQPGWLTTLGPPLYSVFNPSGDNSVVCTDFTVTAGQTKVFNINNQPPPGGMGLTIGFWKNWASCANSNGGQKPTLDRTLQKGDLTLGLLILHDGNSNPDVSSDCASAVLLLNKTTLGGKKASSDPIFNLVAQLVAADLNGLAGAGVSVDAMNAISKAHSLLVTIKFDGNTYTKLTAAQTAQANCLATALDQYNNNKPVQSCQ